MVSNDHIGGVKQVKQEIKDFLANELHLELSDEKTRITHVNEGFDFLGFNIQRVNPERRWVVHLRPTEKGKERVKDKIKELTSRGWTWRDEVTELSHLNMIVRGWAEYYKYTSLHSDIEEITRYTWFRYLQWLLSKHKGSRKHQLVTEKTQVITGRTRWTAEIREGGNTLRVHQWLPTKVELRRKRYQMKGRGGFVHPYLNPEAAEVEDYPMVAETGPEARIYTAALGVSSERLSRNEPLEMGELKLRAKLRDGFRCTRCGRTATKLNAHHTKGARSHRLEDLLTLCVSCHKTEQNQLATNLLDR